MSMCISTAQSVGRDFVSSESEILPARSARFLSCSFFVASVGHPGHFQVWNIVLRDRCKISDVFFMRVAGMALSAHC